MIQRVQTIWLFLASATLFLLFLFPYFQFFDQMDIAKAIKVTGIYQMHEGQVIQTTSFILQAIATTIIALLPLIIIFFYKNRKKQLKLIFLNALLVVILSTWLFMVSKDNLLNSSHNFTITNIGIGTLLIPLDVIFLLLAAQGIRKDEKLVRSADRLR